MDAQLKAKWVEALRSGEFKQASGILRFDNEESGAEFCCLGVLCNSLGAKWISHSPVLGSMSLEDDDESLLSDAALKLVGMDQKTQHALADMNDNGKSFPEIADYIEANL